jgi:biopolymer transport protein ExbD
MNVTNLIDLGFTLLIIFMIATSTSTTEQTIPLNLPSESKSPQQKPDKNTHFVAISVNARGDIFVDEAPEPIGKAELASRLRLLGSQATPPVIRIRGDARVPYEKIVEVMDELKKANLTKITFDTQAVSK